jgi:tRNA pseudouridine55 synthase
MNFSKLNGWININKPALMSSMQVTSFVKRNLGIKKAGHAGTLDVLAKGVLPIAIGEATKLIDYSVDQKKEYKFTIQFGKTTSTGDAEGEILKETDFTPSFNDAKNICHRFIGDIEQIPSSYSAIKVGGIASYKLARKNIEVQIPKRTIQIFSLEMVDYDSIKKQATYYCECSKGTYIRTLAEDISLALQSLGFVLELERTKAGSFLISDSICFQDISETSVDAKTYLERNIQDISCVLDDILVIDIDEITAKKVRWGQEILLGTVPDKDSLAWLRYESKILAIGDLNKNNFYSRRVFNL